MVHIMNDAVMNTGRTKLKGWIKVRVKEKRSIVRFSQSEAFHRSPQMFLGTSNTLRSAVSVGLAPKLSIKLHF